MAGSKEILLGRIRDGEPLALGQQVRLTLYLCGPAIMAQLASVLLQFIDASMVGSLGANPSASIGLISTSTWIFSGFSMAVITGFSVQVAHACGAGDFARARSAMRQGLFTVLAFSLVLGLTGILITRSPTLASLRRIRTALWLL